MSLAIRDEAILLELVQLLENIHLPKERSAVTGGIIGLSAGLSYSLDLTEKLRKELGLGGEIFGYCILTPCVTIATAGVGIGIGSGLERVARAAWALWRGA